MNDSSILTILLGGMFALGLFFAFRDRTAREREWTDADATDGFVCAVEGESFKNDDGTSRQAIIKGIGPGDAITLVHEPTNPKDPHAVKVVAQAGQIGYLRRPVAKRLVAEIENGAEIRALVLRIGRGSNTSNLGVFLKITVKTPR